MASPLKKIKGDKPYKRRNEIELIINELEVFSGQELVQRCIQLNAQIPLEVLLYFLRSKTEHLAPHHFKQVFESLFARLEIALKKIILDGTFSKAYDIREEILARFAELIARDRNSYEAKLDYFEVNFNSGFANFRIDALRQIGPARETDPLNHSSALSWENEESDGPLSGIENKILEDFELGRSKLDDIPFRNDLYAAIRGLPSDERDVVDLLLQGLPIEAKDPSVITISGILNCSVKTVSNRLHRGYSKLRTSLLLEEEL